MVGGVSVVCLLVGPVCVMGGWVYSCLSVCGVTLECRHVKDKSVTVCLCVCVDPCGYLLHVCVNKYHPFIWNTTKGRSCPPITREIPLVTSIIPSFVPQCRLTHR